MKIAILFDGSYFIKKAQDVGNHRRPPKPEDVTFVAEKILANSEFTNDELFRIYFYDCRPYDGTSTHPLTGVLQRITRRHRYLLSVRLFWTP